MEVVIKTIFILILITLSVGNLRERNDMTVLRFPCQTSNSSYSYSWYYIATCS